MSGSRHAPGRARPLGYPAGTELRFDPPQVRLLRQARATHAGNARRLPRHRPLSYQHGHAGRCSKDHRSGAGGDGGKAWEKARLIAAAPWPLADVQATADGSPSAHEEARLHGGRGPCCCASAKQRSSRADSTPARPIGCPVVDADAAIATNLLLKPFSCPCL